MLVKLRLFINRKCFKKIIEYVEWLVEILYYLTGRSNEALNISYGALDDIDR